MGQPTNYNEEQVRMYDPNYFIISGLNNKEFYLEYQQKHCADNQIF